MNFLQKIIKEKQESIERQKNAPFAEELTDKIDLVIRKSRFRNILKEPGTHLIAEIKRASPSKGDLRPDLDIVEIAKAYQKGGIRLISVLTEEKFFKGSLDDLSQVKKNTDLSIICKDFIIDEYQIRQAKMHGADAVLLIAKVLNSDKLNKFLAVVKKFKMDAVVEIHNEIELEKILKLGEDVDIIGINHRNLDDFSIDLNITGKLLPKIPKGKIVIAESGIGSVLEIRQFKQLKVDGILIGESLMLEKDIAIKIEEFMQELK